MAPLRETCAATSKPWASPRASRSRPRAAAPNIGLCAAGSDTVSILAHCKGLDAYRVGIKPLHELRAAMTAANAGEGLPHHLGRFTQEAVNFAAKKTSSSSTAPRCSASSPISRRSRRSPFSSSPRKATS